VQSLEEAVQWAARGQGFPVVLKTDGSWGGQGVRVVHDLDELESAWNRLTKSSGLVRRLKRLVINRDLFAVRGITRRERPLVSIQEHVDGRDAIATVACQDGKVTATVCMEVVHASTVRGPASVVRIISDPRMEEAARRIVEHFGLNGFCGLDFRRDQDGKPILLELNARVTPTCYMLVEGDHHRPRTVALFPPDLANTLGAAGILDVPERSPELVRLGDLIVKRQNRVTAKFLRRLRRQYSR